MSITKDFEDQEQSFNVNGKWVNGYRPDDVAELLAHTRAIEAMLKKHEWQMIPENSDTRFPYSYECPECHREKDESHAPDCQLAKLLEGVE